MIRVSSAFEDIISIITGDTVEAPVDFGERWPVIRTGRRAFIERDLRKLIYFRDGYRCFFCGVHTRMFQLDHIIPWSAGGPDTSANLRAMCQPCNEYRSNYRTRADIPVTPVTRACDQCIRDWVRLYGVARYGRIRPGQPQQSAWCGNCENLSVVTDSARLM